METCIETSVQILTNCCCVLRKTAGHDAVLEQCKLDISKNLQTLSEI